MLDALEHIPWQDLEHAFGKATAVPRWLRGLAAPMQQQYTASLNQLFQHLVQDGVRYNSSAAAVPFLYELLTETVQQDRERL